MKKKTIALIAACAMLFGVATGGTFAWLAASSGTVTNTFSLGDVSITLLEHPFETNNTTQLDKDATPVTFLNDYKIVPGDSQPKDPYVTVAANSEDSYIFLQVQEVNNSTGNNVTDQNKDKVAAKYIQYAIDSGIWTRLKDSSDKDVNVNGIPVYYTTLIYTTQDTDKTYNVLKDKKVDYDKNLTKDDLKKLYGEDGTLSDEDKPKLIFKAFAVQKEAGVGDNAESQSAYTAWLQIADSEKLGYVASGTN